MINIKTPQELDIMREGGLILNKIFEELSQLIVINNTSLEIDKYAKLLAKKYKVIPVFKGYGGFKYHICANLNDIIVHGYPTNQKFKNGDIFGLDFGIRYNGFVLDKSTTIIIGNVEKSIYEFVNKTKISMDQGIQACVVGNNIGDISEAMRKGLTDKNFTLMKDFVGHGIGKNMHEKPEIPGDGMYAGQGPLIKEGMVFAIESISVMDKTNEYYIGSDGWTVFSKNKKLSGLFEETVIVTSNGPEVIT